MPSASRAGFAFAWLCVAAALALARPAWAGEDFGGGSVIFARGAALYRVDATGKGETQIAELAAKVTVRALRSDAVGSVLLADLAGTWAWMPLDGSSHWLIDLPCGDGPAQLAEDGSRVLCRSPGAVGRSLIVELPRSPSGQPRPVGKVRVVDVPTTGARLAGAGAERTLVWADGGGVWTALESDLASRTRVADAPARGFLASPDGGRAIGVFADQIYSDVRHARPAEVLMTLQLDGHGARRKAIRDGVAVDWSHDAQWVLVQDGNSACIMRAAGGQYKCWPGFVAASLSSDGRWGLALGNRDGSRRRPAARPTAKTKAAKLKKGARPAPPPVPAPPPAASDEPAEPREADPNDKPWDHIDEPSDEPESPESELRRADAAAGTSGDVDPSGNDVSIALPTGPLALYRLRLEGAFTDRPALLVKIVDGAAVWVPRTP